MRFRITSNGRGYRIEVETKKRTWALFNPIWKPIQLHHSIKGEFFVCGVKSETYSIFTDRDTATLALARIHDRLAIMDTNFNEVVYEEK